MTATTNQNARGNKPKWPYLIFVAPLCTLITMNWGPYWMYPISMTVVMLCVNKLGQYVDNRWALSLMIWIPVVGLVSWQRQILHMDLAYLSPQQGIIHITKLIWQCHHYAWSLLLIGSLFLHFFDKSWAWIMFLTTFGHIVSGFMIEDLVQHISLGHYRSAEWSIWVVEVIRWLPCIGIFWMWSQNTLIKRAIVAMILLLQVWLTAPFVGLLILSAPRTSPTEQNLPMSLTSLGSTIPGANPRLSDFPAQLNAQGTQQLPHSNWCNKTPQSQWRVRQRAFAVVEMTALSKLEDLKQHIPEIINRGVSEIGFLQENRTKIDGFILNKHLEYPVHHWILDPPPEDTSIGYLEKGKLHWASEKSTNCAIWVPWDTNFQILSNVYEELHASEKCNKPFGLIFGAPKLRWQPPIPCPFENTQD